METESTDVDLAALLERLTIGAGGGAEDAGLAFVEFKGRRWVLILSNRATKDQAAEVVHALHDDPDTVEIPVVQVSHMAKVPKVARRKARKDVAAGVGRQFEYLCSQLEKFGRSTEHAALPVGLDWNGDLTGPLGFSETERRAFLAVVRADGTLRRVDGLGALLLALREESDAPPEAAPQPEAPAALEPACALVIGTEALRVDVTGETIIGRRPECDVVLAEDEEVSGRHLRAAPSEFGIEVEDLGSLNGTKVNGLKIESPTVVRNGETILVGATSIRVMVEGGYRPTRMTPIPSLAQTVRRAIPKTD